MECAMDISLSLCEYNTRHY